jgi:hypothetical protein
VSLELQQPVERSGADAAQQKGRDHSRPFEPLDCQLCTADHRQLAHNWFRHSPAESVLHLLFNGQLGPTLAIYFPPPESLARSLVVAVSS